MEYIEEREGESSDEMMHISGTEARDMFLDLKQPARNMPEAKPKAKDIKVTYVPGQPSIIYVPQSP